MALTPEDFKARYPEFDSVADARVQTFLDEAQLEVGSGPWGTLYEKGVFLLTAHMIVIDQRNQAAGGSSSVSVGQLTSRKVGDVSVTFASQSTSPDGSDEWYCGDEYICADGQVLVGVGAADCDDFMDCDDLSDELGCAGCLPDEVNCLIGGLDD